MRKMKTLFEENERVWFWITAEWKKDFYNELVELVRCLVMEIRLLLIRWEIL